MASHTVTPQLRASSIPSVMHADSTKNRPTDGAHTSELHRDGDSVPQPVASLSVRAGRDLHNKQSDSGAALVGGNGEKLSAIRTDHGNGTSSYEDAASKVRHSAESP